MCAAKRYATKFTLLQELAHVDETIKNPEMILGSSGMTLAPMMSAQRVPMFVKHVSQAMTLNNPEFPRIFTGTENLYGDMSSYYYKAKHKCKIVKVIKKFDTDHVCTIILKDLETGEYDCIERVSAKSFTEVFGFAYNNERLDRLEENDVVDAGEILARSSAYDEYNNHRMGVNALTIFSFHSNLTEDAAMISSSFAQRVTFNKVHRIQIKIPPANMIPLNVHGDAEHYKVIPDIGETVNHNLAALRHISITQMSDLSNDKLMEINRLQDTIYVGKGEIVDISIYSNQPFPDGPVYEQIRKYYDQQQRYYREIYDFCKSIKKSPRTQRLKALFAQSMDHVNEEALWIDKNIIRSVIIDITTQERVHLTPGQKITGRFGNKSVISIIRNDNPDEVDEDGIPLTVVPDDRMPLLPDGRRVDMMVNALSVFNRNISFALYEPCLNAMFDRFLRHIKDWDTDKQFEFITYVLDILNPNFLKEELEAMKKTGTTKKEFMESAYKEGIYLRVEPFVTTLTIRDSVVRLYKEFADILKPEYLQVWYPPRGKYEKSLLPCVAGDTYVLVLKQDGVKGASSRAAGGVSPEGLPIKSNNKANYMADISDTAVKLGEYDRLTFNIGVTNEEFVNYIMLVRASVEGRGWLEKAVYNPDEPIPKRFENRAVRINNCFFNVLGVSLDMVPKQNQIKLPPMDTLQTYVFRNSAVTMSQYDMYWMYRIALRFDRIRRKELKKGKEYDIMDLWNYAFEDSEYPDDWLTEERKAMIIKYADDILLTNK